MKPNTLVTKLVACLMLLCAYVNANTNTEVFKQIEAIEAYSEANIQRLLDMSQQYENAIKIKVLLRLAGLYSQAGKAEQAIGYLDEATSLAKRLDVDLQIEALLAWSDFESKRSNFSSAQNYAEQAVEMAQPDSPLLPNTYHALGLQQSKLLNLKEAEKNIELAIELFKQRSDSAGLKEAYGTMGVIHLEVKDLPGALNYLHQERELIEVLGGQADLASNYYSLGSAYLDSGDTAQAEVYYKKALEIDKTLGDQSYIAADYLGVAYSLYHQKRFTEALENNAKAVEILLEIEAPSRLNQAYVQQVYIYFELKEFESSLQSLEKAMKVARAANVQHMIMAVEFLYGRQFIETNQSELAIQHLTSALSMIRELELEDSEPIVHEMLSDAYALKQDYEKAYSHLITRNESKDKLDTAERREAVERYKRDVNLLEEQLKVSQLEQTQVEQAQILKEQESKQRQLYFMMGVVVLLFFVCVFVLWQRRRLSLMRVKLYEEALQQKQQLFADVSHELRTPLTALKLQITALQSNLVDDVNIGYAKLARKVNEINRLIDDIYQLAQADSLSIELVKEKVDAHELFTNWEQEWRANIEATELNWSAHIDLNNVIHHLDRDRIKQVIDNLLANSAHYTDVPGKVLLSAHSENGQLVVSIEDSAPSVEDDQLGKIFDRLYRVESSRSRQTGGSGLGLSICESLVKGHGGSIQAEKSEMGGLKIIFKI